MKNIKAKLHSARHFILGFLTCALIFSFVMGVSAWSGIRTANLVYDNVKVNIDGRDVTLTDLEGRALEPIFIDDTLYVPMSPMARAFGKKSVYEGGAKKTLFITTPVNTPESSVEGIKLGDLPVNSQSGNYRFDYQKECRTNSGDYLFDCVLMQTWGYWESSQEYSLGGQYQSIKGTMFVLWDDRSSNNKATVKFYGDGKLLYGSTEIIGDTKYINFNINLDGVKILKIVFEGGGGNGLRVGLSDTILYKYK